MSNAHPQFVSRKDGIASVIATSQGLTVRREEHVNAIAFL
jgi:hypothetical protein